MCAIESFLISSFTRCGSQYRQVKEDPSDMCIQEREMSPISPVSTDIPNHTQISSDLPNHHQYNKYPGNKL